MNKKVFTLFFGILFIYACGYREGIIQKAEKSYLKFSGNWENASVQIDDMAPFVLKPPAGSEDSERKPAGYTLYQLSPGRHSLKVYRDGSLLVNRILILENQATMEIQIP